MPRARLLLCDRYLKKSNSSPRYRILGKNLEIILFKIIHNSTAENNGSPSLRDYIKLLIDFKTMHHKESL